ncbi:MAG: hypothetical protein IJL26_12900 [Clostridia bacterium]|nr:hypothetical protein [Clostridia bacterium]
MKIGVRTVLCVLFSLCIALGAVPLPPRQAMRTRRTRSRVFSGCIRNP